MKPILTFFVLLLTVVSAVLSLSESFFKGHFVGYDIPPPNEIVSRAEVVTNNFSQKLDHFDPTNSERFLQRYFVNPEYFNSVPYEVVFLWIAGEGQASIGWMTGGSWIESAKKYGALLFQLEHRFYGVSHPFTDLSTENLKYLSSRQALEDIATFISAMNKEYNLQNPRWIAYGGSYAGSLAAWARQKYPHLVQGAVCSSGPLFAKLEFPEYIEVVISALAAHSRECVDSLKNAFDQLENLITNPGDENVTEIFNLCYDISETNMDSEITNLFETISNYIFVIAQYSKNVGRTFSVDDICDILVNEENGDEVYRLAELNSLFYGSTTCMDYRYQSTVDYLNNVNVTATGNMRQWVYQTCTEYGWYLTSDQEEKVFGNRFTAESSIQLCEDVYGVEYNSSYIINQIAKTNTHYGGYDIDVRNVVFVHGSFDPWHPMGLTETTRIEAPVIVIEGKAHCSDLYTASEDDIPALTAAREEVDRLVGVWLGVKSSAAGTHLTVLHMLLVVISCIVKISI